MKHTCKTAVSRRCEDSEVTLLICRSEVICGSSCAVEKTSKLVSRQICLLRSKY